MKTLEKQSAKATEDTHHQLHQEGCSRDDGVADAGNALDSFGADENDAAAKPIPNGDNGRSHAGPRRVKQRPRQLINAEEKADDVVLDENEEREDRGEDVDEERRERGK